MTTTGRKKLWVLTAVAAGVMAVPAQANPITMGPPANGGSWSQNWTQQNVAGGSFDMIAVMIFSDGDSFDPPVVSRLPAGWSVNFVSSSLVIFSSDSGANVADLTFNLHYNGTIEDEGLVIETAWATFRDGMLVENIAVTRGISGQDFDLGEDWSGDFASPWEDPASDVGMALVPLPAPLAMGALGLFAVVLGRKRLRRLAG